MLSGLFLALGLAAQPPQPLPALVMEVTQEDLRRQCSTEHDAFTQCVARGHTEQCLTQQLALERCATATVQLVRAINATCSKEYARFQACYADARERPPDCDKPSLAVWACAQPHIDRAEERVST